MPDVKKYGYEVRVNAYCEYSRRSQEEFGSWSSRYTNTLEPLIVKTNKYPDVISIHNLDVEDEAYVVWVEWSSGDSFGRGYCTDTQIMGLCIDETAAYELKRGIETINYEEMSPYTIKLSDGQDIIIQYAPWYGYFEKLESVRVDKVIVSGEKVISYGRR